jgi:hypothetical protein
LTTNKNIFVKPFKLTLQGVGGLSDLFEAQGKRRKGERGEERRGRKVR